MACFIFSIFYKAIRGGNPERLMELAERLIKVNDVSMGIGGGLPLYS